MKGKIVLQRIREEKLSKKGWPVFDREEAVFGLLDRCEHSYLILENGYKAKLQDSCEFMVSLEDGSLAELNHDNIDEAMGNDWWDYYHNPKMLEFSVENGIASVVIEPHSLRSTERGFAIGEFKDQYGLKCSIQKSSIATKDCIWLGVDDASPEIMVSDARRLGITDSNANGWMPYEVPREVLMHTRMHLSREDVKKLLPILQKFADTGEL